MTIIRTGHPLEAIDGTNLGIVNQEKHDEQGRDVE
jgi:hypothetical protein